jgi:tetratricopeptide (TPR) repeat protein
MSVYREDEMTARTLLIALALSITARAELLELKSGEVLDGTPIAVDDARVVVRPKNGSSERIVQRADLTVRGYLKARAATLGDDGMAHLEIARLAIDAGLHAFARSHLAHAEHFDAALAEATAELRAESDRRGAATLLALADDAANRGDTKDAKRLAELVVRRYPDTPAHLDAIAVLDSLATSTKPKAVSSGARTPDPIQATSELAKTIASAREHQLDGRKIAKGNKAREHYEHAISALERMLVREKDHDGADADHTALHLTANALLVELRLDLGHVYSTRGSFENAREQGALALALAPDDPTVKEFRAHVERLIFEAWGRYRLSR